MSRCDEILMEICGNSTKKKKFSGNFGWIITKFGQFSSKILSRSWLNFWENFRKICWNFRETFGNEYCKTFRKILGGF